jgi:glutaredoxin
MQRRGMLLPLVIGKSMATIEPMDPSPPRSDLVDVLMYSRRTCGLCDEARAVIDAELRRTSFSFREVFIDRDEALEREYGLRVPVVLVRGSEEFEFRVEPVRFRRLLGQASRS